MKIQIRRNVFETNSSSTHSLQLTNRDKDGIIRFIQERNEQDLSERTILPESFIHGKTLYLEGFEIPSGGEEGNVYCVIQSWAAKLQYLAMYIESEQPFNYDDCVNDIKDFALKQYQSHGYDITNVEFVIDHELSWYDGECSEIPNFNMCRQSLETSELRQEAMKNFMADDVSMIYMDEAYHGWEPTEILFV